MKLDIQINEHSLQIARYLSGEMEPDELQTFRDKYLGDSENVQLLDSMKRDLELIDENVQSSGPMADKAWGILKSRFEAEGMIPETTTFRKLNPVYKVARIAAVLLVLLGCALLIYLGVTRRNHPIEMVQLSSSVSDDATLIKTLSDGSIIYLASNSSLNYPVNFDEKTRSVNLQGKAFFDIAHDAEKPFIIHSDAAVVQVLGTAFTVNSIGANAFDLSVERGKVKVSLTQFPSFEKVIVAGERLSAQATGAVVSHFSSGEGTWYTEKMHFKDEALKNIVNVLNRNFNTNFVLNSPDLGNRKLTVTFSKDTKETITELICLALNLKSEVRDNSILLSEKVAEKKGN